MNNSNQSTQLHFAGNIDVRFWLRNLIILGLFLSQTSWGALYKFEFKAPAGPSFKIPVESNSKKEAFEVAAQECFNQLTGAKGSKSKVRLTEDQAMDVVDTCANPKSL